jgi:predicted transcriptional regulator
MRRVANDDRTPQDPELYFETLEELRRILTPKRQDLLLAITQHRPSSIRQLAEFLGRDYKNVSTDVVLLHRLGLVTLEGKGGKGKPHAPTVPYDEIQVTIDLRQPHTARAA